MWSWKKAALAPCGGHQNCQSKDNTAQDTWNHHCPWASSTLTLETGRNPIEEASLHHLNQGKMDDKLWGLQFGMKN